MTDAYAECERIVREEDPDRAVAVMFAPADKRRHLHALYAFDIEIAKIRQIVSQPLPGEIRLQWWRDRIDAQAEDPAHASGQGSPMAAALLETVAEHQLPADAFRNLLEARIFDLYDDPMPSRGDFESYAGETTSAIMILAAMVLDREAAPSASEAAGHAGVAVAAERAIRMLPVRPQNAQIFFSDDILAAVGATREALRTGDREATGRAVQAMAAFAHDHLATAQSALRGLEPTLRPAFLPLELMRRNLKALEGGAASPPGRAGQVHRLFAYWRAMRR